MQLFLSKVCARKDGSQQVMLQFPITQQLIENLSYVLTWCGPSMVSSISQLQQLRKLLPPEGQFLSTSKEQLEHLSH